MRQRSRRHKSEAAAAAGSDRKRRRGAPWTARRTLVGLTASWALLQRKQLQQWLVHIMRATLRSIQLAGATLDSVWWPYHEPTELHGPRLTARRFVGPPVDGAALPRRRIAFRLIPFAGVLLTSETKLRSSRPRVKFQRNFNETSTKLQAKLLSEVRPPPTHTHTHSARKNNERLHNKASSHTYTYIHELDRGERF